MCLEYLRGNGSGCVSGLRMCGNHCNLVVGPLFEILKTNRNLLSVTITTGRDKELWDTETVDQAVELFQQHNLTLLKCLPLSQINPKIQYFLDMNAVGRATVRTGTIEDLVKCLEKAQNNNDDPRFQRDINHVQSALFGLLLERPSIWSQQR